MFQEDFKTDGFNLWRLKLLARITPLVILINIISVILRHVFTLKGNYWEIFANSLFIMSFIIPHMFIGLRQLKEYKDVEDQLVKSKEKYKSVVDGVREVIFQVDKNGKFIFLNSAWERLTSFNIDESLGNDFYDFVLDENRENGLKVFSKLINGEIENCTYEVETKSKEGKQFWIEVLAQPSRDDEGRIVGVSGIINDISIRKNMENELVKKDKLLRGISEATHILLGRTDYENAFKDSLKKLGELTGADRINIFSRKVFEKNRTVVFSWSKDELSKKNELIEALPVQHDSLRGWIKILEKGNLISGITEDFSAEERKVLNAFNIKSIFIMPIIIDDAYIGCIEFIDYTKERIWSEIEKTTLLTAAISIGSAIKRIKGEEELKKALKNDFTIMVKNLQNIVFRLKRNEKGEFYYTLFEGKLAEVIGYTTETMLGKNIVDILGEEKANYVAQYYKRAFEGEYVTYEFELNNRITFATLSPIFDNGRVIEVIGSVIDITDGKEAQKKIHYMAYYDMLTGLPNRILFKDKLKSAIEGAVSKYEHVAVAFFDLDNFKKINDTLGHATGDLLLKEVSNRLKKILSGEELAARMGGDEFTLLLPEIKNREHAAGKAKEVLDVFKESFKIYGNEFFITPSIGISIYPEDGQDIDELVKNADMAMYRAKDYGKNNFQFYTASMNNKAVKRLKMENDLRRAIENNELFLVYQPKIDIGTKKITGCEALVRWNHPENGFVSPAEFIPFAEETGLIIPIGEWVLYTACMQNKLWQERGGKKIRVSVNISAVQFNQGNLIESVSSVLAKTELNPEYLELEITENIIMQNTEKVLEDLQRIKTMGVSISIDDFGTGFSSLSYLKKFAIDIIKIDQSFIRDINNDQNDKAIATAIINMAKGLNLKVIAEGVETEEQLSMLAEKQCDEIQGYLSGRPMDIESFQMIIEADNEMIKY